MSRWNSSMKRALSARGSSPASFALVEEGRSPRRGRRGQWQRQRQTGGLGRERGLLGRRSAGREAAAPLVDGPPAPAANFAPEPGVKFPPVDDLVVDVREVPHVLDVVPQQLGQHAVEHVKGDVHARVAWRWFWGRDGRGSSRKPPPPAGHTELLQRRPAVQDGCGRSPPRLPLPPLSCLCRVSNNLAWPRPCYIPTDVAIVVDSHAADVHLQLVPHARPRPQRLLRARHRVVQLQPRPQGLEVSGAGGGGRRGGGRSRWRRDARVACAGRCGRGPSGAGAAEAARERWPRRRGAGAGAAGTRREGGEGAGAAAAARAPQRRRGRSRRRPCRPAHQGRRAPHEEPGCRAAQNGGCRLRGRG
jgi:hypothetical protein